MLVASQSLTSVASFVSLMFFLHNHAFDINLAHCQQFFLAVLRASVLCVLLAVRLDYLHVSTLRNT